MEGNLLFVTGCYPIEKQQYYLNNSINPYSMAANVLSWKIINGFDEVIPEKFVVYSCPFVPSFPKDYKKLFVKSYKWKHSQKSIGDKVVGFLNFRIICVFRRYVKLYREISKWIKQSKSNRKIMFYSNDVSFLMAAKKIKSKFKDVLIVDLITDLNEYDYVRRKPNSLINKFINFKHDYRVKKIYSSMESVDRFILLAEKMKDYINIKSRDYLVVEGIAASKFNRENSFSVDKKIVVYTGNISERYGVVTLARAFASLDETYELILCGDGTAREEIVSITKQTKNVKYLGMVCNEEAIRIQESATLLVNPMPNFGIHTSLSFPSKLMEYMLRAKPVICFKVPGIPDEYDQYLRYFKNYDVTSIAKDIQSICELDVSELIKIGEMNREFILKEKSEIPQAKRIISFINK